MGDSLGWNTLELLLGGRSEGFVHRPTSRARSGEEGDGNVDT
jgi:hypothetical protein